MAGPFKAVFFDFYGTIASGDVEAVERACAHVVRDFDLPITAREMVVEWGNRFFAEVDACRVNGFRRLYDCECASLVATCAQWVGQIDPTPYADELFEYMSFPNLHPEAKEVLQSIDLPKICVSNADDDHLLPAIERHGLEFDAVVSSEQAASYKPESAIFEHALEVFSLKPRNVLHVGDSLHSDVGGARSAGICAVWVCRERRIHDVGSGEADHKISSLSDLRRIVAA